MKINTLNEFYNKHKRWIPIVSFLLGFLLDTVLLNRIDELKTIIQQACYLSIAVGLLCIELLEQTREIEAPRILKKIWKYREFFFHFLLGTLLNSYTIFYFKSASAWTSFIFIGLLVAILIVNEFLRFGKSQLQVHVALVSLCSISYLETLAPILLGFIGIVPFLIGVVASLCLFAFLYLGIRSWFTINPNLLKTHFIYPYLSVHIFFTGLYFANVIPPVPLAVSYMGIYHNAEKHEDGYHLSFGHPSWHIWERGDETFLARPGESLFCFAQIFSPTRFSEKLHIRWLLWNEGRGWQIQDTIPLQIIGGREEGYRIITAKSNYQPGQWRVQIETELGQEIGRLNFNVVQDGNTGPRNFQVEIR